MATKKGQELVGERLEMRYVPLSTAVLWEKNPKRHDMGSIIGSIEQNGFVDPPKFDAALGALVFGNGRTHALQIMLRDGKDRPRGILEDEDGQWYVPIMFGVDAISQAAAVRFAIDHNNLTLLGGDFGPNDLLRMYDDGMYKDALRGLADDDMLPITVDGDDLDALLAAPVDLAEKAKGNTKPQLEGLIYSVVVTCESEQQQTELLARFKGEGLPCKPLIS